jgi:hydroxymethylglutaryl-CoA lyase
MSAISLYEVGPRDGLQSLPRTVPLRKRVKLIKRLREAGLEDIEVGSLVHPSVLAMRDSDRLYRKTGGDLLVVNAKGFDRARELGLDSVNAVISPHHGFNSANQNDTCENIMRTYERESKTIPINRLYISCAFSDKTSESDVLDCVRWGEGISQCVVICDTDSSASVETILSLCGKAMEITPRLGIHLHLRDDDTKYIDAAYRAGIRQFDCSVGGLGGCVSLDGTHGNLRTESLVRWAMANDIPLEGDIDVDSLITTGEYAHSLANRYSQTRLDRLHSLLGRLYQ